MGNCMCENSQQMQGIRETKDIFINDGMVNQCTTPEKDENLEEAGWEEVDYVPEIKNPHVIRIL